MEKNNIENGSLMRVYCADYNKYQNLGRLEEKEQREYKMLRRANANDIKVNWTVTKIEDFKKSLGKRWQTNMRNFAKLVEYAEAQLKRSMPNNKTKQKWTLEDEPAISLSDKHIDLQEIFADDKTELADIGEDSKLRVRARKVMLKALESNLIACVDDSYSTQNLKVNFTKLYKFNPALIEFVKNFNKNSLNSLETSTPSTSLSLSSSFNSFDSSITPSSLGDPETTKPENESDLSQFFTLYKLDKFAKPQELVHTPGFIKQVLKAKYAPLVINPDYEGDGYMDTYHLNYKVKLKDGKLVGLSCREWTPFTQTTKNKKDGLLYRDDICREYFGDESYNWDVNGSLYRMNAALNGKELDPDKDVYLQMWIEDGWPTESTRDGFKLLCMSAFMTRNVNDFIFGQREAYRNSHRAQLPEFYVDCLKNVWYHMREVIGESYRTEALFVAGAFEKVVRFALARQFREQVLQCFDNFVSGQYNTAEEAKRIYNEIIRNEEALDVARDVIAGRIPQSTLQDIFRDII